jgi:hypothetical protein
MSNTRSSTPSATLSLLTITKINKQGNSFTVSSSASDKFEVQFNPTTLKLKKQNHWDFGSTTGKNLSSATFKGGQPQSQSFDLLFDSTDTGASVLNKFEKLMKLAKVDTTKSDSVTGASEPPFVKVQWGNYISFTAAIKDFDVDFLMFKADGTPLRAKVTLTLQEVVGDEQSSQNPTSVSEPRKTWIVQEGQRLDWIAFQEYGDTARWRLIADANGLNDPLNLVAGQVLVLPVPQETY